MAVEESESDERWDECRRFVESKGYDFRVVLTIARAFEFMRRRKIHPYRRVCGKKVLK